VTVVERSSYDSPRVGEALPPEVRRPLSELGVWDRFMACGPLPSPGITAAWGSAELTHNDFIANPLGPGWHVDRRQFDEMLARAAEASGVEVLRAARSTSPARDGSGAWHVEATRGDSTIERQASALVDATGRSAAPARRLGSRRITFDRLIGLWTCSVGAADRDSTDRRTLVEATDCGWWYSALLPDGRHVAALMTDAALLPVAPGSRNSFWSRCLERAPHTMSRIGHVSPGNGLRVVPARSSRLDTITGPGWLAVGDAAMSFDPLSSRGVTWALESGLAAARAHDAFLQGDPALISDFARRAAWDFTSYLKERDAIYACERRWPDSPFWQRWSRNEFSHEFP
jgi:flavin-dependent dehydrogenase